MTTENPFDGREHGGLVFLTNPERCFYIGLSPSQQKQWLRDHPERWQTREDALRDLQARAGADVEAEPPEARSTTSANEVRRSGEVDGPSPAPAEDKRPPDKPPMNAAPLTIANAEATAAADDEITIGEPRFISERRVAVMPEKSQGQWDTREQVLRTRVTMHSDASVTDSDPGLDEPPRETESLPHAEAATTETKGSKAEPTLPGTTGRKRGRSGSELGKQKPPAGMSKSAPMLSPKIMRIVLNSLKKYPIQWHAASKAGIHRKTLEYWLKRSAAGDAGYDVEWRGFEWRFHEHCKSAIDEAHDELHAVVWQIAWGVIAKTDENGNLILEACGQPNMKMMLFYLELKRPETWGKNRKTDIPQKGGVLVIGEVTKKPKYNTARSVKARKWKADSRRIREEKE
jgi:hypothetical protein